MKKPPTLSQQLEFARLRAFVVAGYEHVLSDLPAMPETHPGAVADKMWEEGHRRALRGLREAAADVVELMQDLDDAQLAAFELRLKQAGAPSLAAMREGRVARPVCNPASRHDPQRRRVAPYERRRLGPHRFPARRAGA